MLDKITKGTIDGTKSAKDFTIKKWKRFIRKRALKRVAQKDMRKYSNIVEGSIRRYIQSKT